MDERFISNRPPGTDEEICARALASMLLEPQRIADIEAGLAEFVDTDLLKVRAHLARRFAFGSN